VPATDAHRTLSGSLPLIIAALSKGRIVRAFGLFRTQGQYLARRLAPELHQILNASRENLLVLNHCRARVVEGPIITDCHALASRGCCLLFFRDPSLRMRSASARHLLALAAGARNC